MAEKETRPMTCGEKITSLCRLRDRLTGTDKDALTWAIQQIQDKVGMWISVKDRLPEVDEYGESARVLTHDTRGVVTPNWLRKDGTWGKAWSYRAGNHVTHWMPVPDPPEEAVDG